MTLGILDGFPNLINRKVGFVFLHHLFNEVLIHYRYARIFILFLTLLCNLLCNLLCFFRMTLTDTAGHWHTSVQPLVDEWLTITALGAI